MVWTGEVPASTMGFFGVQVSFWANYHKSKTWMFRPRGVFPTGKKKGRYCPEWMVSSRWLGFLLGWLNIPGRCFCCEFQEVVYFKCFQFLLSTKWRIRKVVVAKCTFLGGDMPWKNKLESCSGKKRYVNVTQVNDFDVIGILGDGSVCKKNLQGAVFFGGGWRIVGNPTNLSIYYIILY